MDADKTFSKARGRGTLEVKAGKGSATILPAAGAHFRSVSPVYESGGFKGRRFLVCIISALCAVIGKCRRYPSGMSVNYPSSIGSLIRGIDCASLII